MFWVKETYINASTHSSFGDSEWYEAGDDTLGSLFKAFQSEYGRCTSKMYIDRDQRFDGPSTPIQVGWCFEKTKPYDGTIARQRNDTYLQETWIEVSSTKPVRVNYMNNVTSPWMGRKER